MSRFLAMVFLLLSAGSASAENVRFRSVAVGTSAAGPEITGWLYRPSGAGPFPAIVLAHTCGGVSEHTNVWGNLLASCGYVVVAPDSFGPSGVKSVCGRGDVVNGSMRVADVAGALDFTERPVVRVPGRYRPDRPQPWRLDDDAGGAEEL
jgi:poly(3-hydroxybutyrate) depolymerase